MGSYQVLIVTERDNDYSSPKQWTLTPPTSALPQHTDGGPHSRARPALMQGTVPRGRKCARSLRRPPPGPVLCLLLPAESHCFQ